MSDFIFNQSLIEDMSQEKFESNSPSPWASFDGLLSQQVFEELMETFPSLDLFEKHSGMARHHGQRPHDRWYLALEHSIYDNKTPGQKGCVSLKELHPAWQRFVDALRTSESYQKLIRRTLGNHSFDLRFAWHVAGQGCDVSPHVDDPLKGGTHIFYFNTAEDWKEEWGGQTLFLKNPAHNGLNPEISDFESSVAAPIVDNKSMLFRNTDQAWHGVATIECEPGHHRRLFNAIFQLKERPHRKPNIVRRLASRTRQLFSR